MPNLQAQSGINRKAWTALQEQAQEIGLCLYMSSMLDDRCKCLQDKGGRTVMAPLNRGWARTRMMKWMMKRGKLPQKAILIYDKYTNTSKRGGELSQGFFIFSLEELEELSLRSIGQDRHVMSFVPKGQKKALLNNTYRREFSTKKQGRTLDKGQWYFHGVTADKAKAYAKAFNEILNSPE